MTAWSSANTNRSCSTARTEADVSTRTIYNHFEGKEQLFFAVIEDSATRVADSQTDMIDRHLGEVNDLESDLVALGREWVTIRPGTSRTTSRWCGRSTRRRPTSRRPRSTPGRRPDRAVGDRH